MALAFDLTSRYLTCAGDKHVTVLHNVTGHQATIVELEEKRRKATNSAYRDRLQEQIQEARWVCARVSVCDRERERERERESM